MVAAAVIASGLLALHFALSTAVGAVAVALAAVALASAGWQRRAHTKPSAR